MVTSSHMQFLDALVEQPCCINWVDGSEHLVGLLLYMQDCVNSLVAVGTQPVVFRYGFCI